MIRNLTQTTPQPLRGLKSLAVAGLLLAAITGNAQTTFNYTGSMQTYTVPPGVTSIRIDAQGAQGGSITIACPATGGLGARMEGDVTVTPGEVLQVLVGGQGQTQGEDGGGGGGSFVVRTGNIPLVVAGGGGGATNNIQLCTGLRNGVNASITTSGTASSNGLVAGGTAGNGGGANVGSGCGGGGFYTDGAYAANMNGRGRAFVNGGAGGTGQNNNHGGYGGGGCGWYNGGNGGGGGGYSGGGTDGNYPSTYFGGGGGGGSFNSGTNQVNTAGFRSGNGLVVITPLAQAGAALDFDGTNDVATGTAPNMQNTDFTIEFWAKRRTGTTTQGFFLIGTDGINNSAIFMYMFNNGGLSFGFWGNDLVISQGSGLYQDLNWHHYALTYNTTTNERIVYRDGVQIGSDIATADYIGNTNLMIGQFGGHSRTDGAIDEFRIWKRLLCQAEIQNNMNCEIATTGTNLEANYHFNQGTAGGPNAGVTTLTDVSGFNRNCTLTGFALTGTTSNWIQPGGVVSGVSCSAFSNTVTGTLSTQTNVSCNAGNDGVATVTAGGLGAYIYSWAPGGGTAATASGLTAGTYTCTISNACGGSTTVSVTITEPAVLAVAASSGSVSCSGGSDGTATATPSGGTAPYTYMWSNGGTTQTISGLSLGVYTCTVTCTNGCTATQTVSVTEPAVLAATSMQTNVSCFGGSNGDAMVMPAGGTPGYTYNWLPTGGTLASASGLTAGTYTCTITDANGCSTTQSVTITDPPVLSATSTSVNTLCNGSSDGSASVTVTGGTPGYTYSWAPSGGTASSATGLNAGTYTCTITDANNCVMTQTVLVSEPDALIANPTSTSALCNGNSNGSATVAVFGGTSPYTYSWAPAGGTAATATGLAAGTYTCTITDLNNCVTTQTVQVTEPAILAGVITTATNPIFCNGTNGSIDLSVNGGTPNYSYSWSNSATTQDVNGLSAGTYSVTITDANNCTTTQTVTLSDPNPPTVTLSLPVATVCAADGAYVLSGGSPAGGSYSGPGVSGTLFTPANASVGMNTITYSYTDLATGCVGTNTDVIFVDACIGITESANSSSFIVFPNPNNGSFTLQLKTTDAADVLIYDALGKLISSTKVKPDVQQQLQLTDAGMYLVTVITADGQRTSQRVVVNK